MRPPLRPLLSLAAGFALGSGAVWAFRTFQNPPSPSVASAASAPSASSLPAPSASPHFPALVLPPLLEAAEADAALDAYLALAPLEAKAPEAEILERLGRLRALLTLLPVDRFPRLFMATAERGGPAETRLRRAAFDVWVEQDAPAAARWMLAFTPIKTLDAAARARYLAQAAAAWSRDDFDAAYAWSTALGDAKLVRDLRTRLLGQLAATDPRRALALLPDASGDAEALRAARHAVFDAWSERDPASALQALGPSLQERRDDRWRVQQALTKWVIRDPASALDWALAHGDEDEPRRSSLLHLGWALAEKPGALRPFLDLVQSRPDIPGHGALVRNLLGSWASRDHAAAVAWLDRLPDAETRGEYISQALLFLSEKPDAFLALVSRLPESPDRDQKIAIHFDTWTQRDPEAALAWLERNPDPLLASAAARLEGALVGQLAASDPAAALARWEQLPQTSRSPIIAARIAEKWSATDPAAATRWLVGQLSPNPSNPADHQAYFKLQSLTASWLKTDLPGYIDWAQKLPAHTWREFAIHSISAAVQNYTYQADDPPPRAEFAGQLAQISDPQIRERALTSHLHAWLRSDARAARDWLETHDALSPEAAARILADAKPGP